MGDDSSPTTDTEVQPDQIDVDAAEASYHDRTAPVPDFFNSIGRLVGYLGFAFLIGVVMEIGQRVGRDFHYRMRR